MTDTRPAPLMAVDLDGTLLAGNSLHEYIRAGMWHLLRHGRLATAASLAACMLMRRAGLIAHTDMKWRVAALIGRDKAMLDGLHSRLRDKMRPEVVKLMADHVAAGGRVMIATATFDFIADNVAPYPCIATPYDGNDSRSELRGQAKADAVARYAAEHSAYIAVAVTDHHDDLPLIRLADRVILVAPSQATVSLVQETGKTSTRL